MLQWRPFFVPTTPSPIGRPVRPTEIKKLAIAGERVAKVKVESLSRHQLVTRQDHSVSSQQLPLPETSDRQRIEPV